MDEKEKCIICKKEISKDLDICPYCGSAVIKSDDHVNHNNRYDYDKEKKLKHLHEIELTLYHLEEELDAFLCKKR